MKLDNAVEWRCGVEVKKTQCDTNKNFISIVIEHFTWILSIWNTFEMYLINVHSMYVKDWKEVLTHKHVGLWIKQTIYTCILPNEIPGKN